MNTLNDLFSEFLAFFLLIVILGFDSNMIEFSLYSISKAPPMVSKTLSFVKPLLPSKIQQYEVDMDFHKSPRKKQMVITNFPFPQLVSQYFLTIDHWQPMLFLHRYLDWIVLELLYIPLHFLL